MTKNQKQWIKELNRIKRFIRQATKRGYDFSQFVLPSRPQRVTAKQLSIIKSLTPTELYKYAKYKTPTGKTMTGTERRAQERRIAAAKGRYTKDLKKRIEKYIAENAKPLPDIEDGGKDYADVADTIIMQDGVAIDPLTGEVIFELDSDVVVFSADDIIGNFKQRLKGIDSKSNSYKSLLEKWIDTLIKVLGKEKVALSLERLAHLDKLIYRAVKYENDFLFFTWEHMNNFILQGWLDREIAETIMSEFEENEDEYFSDGLSVL